jgi:DNA-binding FadR family transcriptional regulator
MRERNFLDTLSEFLKYLARSVKNNKQDRIPALAELSQELGISTAALREQLEVARTFGLVEVRPKTGIRTLPYSFSPVVCQSLAYAMAVDPAYFKSYSDLRTHVEEAYWYEAVSSLNAQDIDYMRGLIAQAQNKLHGRPIQIPHQEHRELHMCIYRRLNNPFVTGLLEAYWEVYEAVGLDLYTDYQYLEQVWNYHARMVEQIAAGNFTAGYQAMAEHMQLLSQRQTPLKRQQFE